MLRLLTVIVFAIVAACSRRLAWRLLPRQIAREDATFTRKVAHVQRPSVSFYAAPTDRQPKPETRSVAAALLKWLEQVFGLARREAAALILNLDQHALVVGACSQRD